MILVSIATHAGDIDQAIELAKQITEIGGASAHKAQVVVADTVSNDKIEELKNELLKAFYSVDLDIVKAQETRGPLDPSTAPHAPAANSMFRETLRVITERGNTLPILLIEPDITVLSADWLDKLESEYIRARASGKEILAAKIPLRNYSHQIVQAQKPLTGVFRRLVSVKQDAKSFYSPIPMVIPPNFSEITQLYQKSRWTPWEITSRLELEAKIGATELITHSHDSTNWRLEDGMFYFDAPAEDKSTRAASLDTAVIVHGTKDASLFNLIFREPALPEVVKQDLQAAFEILDAKVDTAYEGGDTAVKVEGNITEDGKVEVTSITAVDPTPVDIGTPPELVEEVTPTEPTPVDIGTPPVFDPENTTCDVLDLGMKEVDKSPEPAKVDARAAAIAARNKKK